MAYFDHLNYSLGEEDPAVEHALLPAEGKTVLAVAGSGARVLPLLARRPKKLICTDVSVAQLALTALRMELVRTASRDEFLKFLGYREGCSPAMRKELFSSLHIPDELARPAHALLDGIDWAAPLYFGKFERMLISLSRVNRFFTGHAGQRLFSFTRLEDQVDYYDRGFPMRRWQAVVSLLGNAGVLNQLLYKGEFPKNNTGRSTASVYRSIFDRLFRTQVARHSYFLQILFFGRIAFEDGLPMECDPRIFDACKDALSTTAVEYRTSSMLDCLSRGEAVDFCSLSDVASFLPDEAARSVLQQLRPFLTPGAVIVSRGHLRFIPPDTNGFVNLVAQTRDLTDSERTGLWQFGIYQVA